MSGIGEASLVLGLISSTIAIFEAAQEIYEAASDTGGLPRKLRMAAEQIPFLHNALSLAEQNINAKNVTEEALQSAKPVLERCRESAVSVKDIFDKTIPAKDASRAERLRKAVGIKMKSNKVKEYMEEIFKGMELLAQNQVFQDAEALKDIKEAIEQLSNVPDEEEQPQFVHSGAGAINANTGGGTQKNYNNSGPGSQYNAEKQFFGRDQASTVDDINQACLRALRCPDSLVIKNRLKENKDKLLHKSIDWIFKDERYHSWQNSDNLSLLWIKGGAGKGKTVMSIGLIEELSRQPKHATVVTYFFCQNADYELNTIAAIIKGLMLQLVSEQQELKKSFRDRWDAVNERFNEDVSSWRGLWDIFVEMLDRCTCPRVYVVVDALDECRNNGMANLLKLIVRTGHGRVSQIKWLLTSRPLDSAKQELLAGSDQVMVSLELNSKYISAGVRTYVAYKVAELDRRCSYGTTLRRELEMELIQKAEDTFLWVSLVCKKLEGVRRDQVMTTVRDLPPGLTPYYHRILTQLCDGESSVVTGCIRLLKVMVLTYRPLNVSEVSSVTGLPEEELATEALVDRCASFVKMRGKDIEFVHQSARDYLAGENGLSPLDHHGRYGHDDIAMSCLRYLSRRLKVNLADLPRPDSTIETTEALKDTDQNVLLASLNYAATFWAEHLKSARQSTLVQRALADHGEVVMFLHTKFLEWLESLSLLDKVSQAIEILKTIADAAEDATRFLLRHYQTVATWPLQLYSSALVFSPETSLVKRKNIDKISGWLTKASQIEGSWSSLIQTLAGHSGEATTVAYSPDGHHIASGSLDGTIKLWDATTGRLLKTLTVLMNGVNAVAFSREGRWIASGSRYGDMTLWDSTTGKNQQMLFHSSPVTAVAFSADGLLVASGSLDWTVKLLSATTGHIQTTLTGHSSGVTAVAFSPDSQQVASGSSDKTIKLFESTTGKFKKTLAGHLSGVTAIAFSTEGQRLISASLDKTIKLWNFTTGEVQKTLAGHFSGVTALAFSPDCHRIASASCDRRIKLWDTATGKVQQTLLGHSDSVNAVAFSPDGQRIATASRDTTVKVWDTTTSEVQETRASHWSVVTAVAISPNGQCIASGSQDKNIKLWNSTTGEIQKTLAGHSSGITTVAFSPDGLLIASGSWDSTVRLWNTMTGEIQQTMAGHSNGITALAFSPDGQRIVSGSHDTTIKLWDAMTGEIQKTLAGHSNFVSAIAFSPDGRRIVSGGQNVRLWNAMTGEIQKTLWCDLSTVTAVAFSSDGHQIVSASYSNKIYLWDIVKCLRTSRLLGSTLGSRIPRVQPSYRISTSGPMYKLPLSADGRYLATNLGSVKLDTAGAERDTKHTKPLPLLSVSNGWIQCGGVSVLRLSPDFRRNCFDVNKDHVAIGLVSGHVLSIGFDLGSLLSVLNSSLYPC